MFSYRHERNVDRWTGRIAGDEPGDGHGLNIVMSMGLGLGME